MENKKEKVSLNDELLDKIAGGGDGSSDRVCLICCGTRLSFIQGTDGDMGLFKCGDCGTLCHLQI